MSSLSADLLVTPQDLFSQVANVSTTVPYNTGTPALGGRAVTGDGREFRYAQAGGSNLVVGNLLQAPAQVANHRRQTPTAAVSAGATSVTMNIGATAVTLNEYLGGWLVVEDDSGGTGGFQYQIAGNPAATQSTTVKLTLVDPVVVAITTSAHLSLVSNPYAGVIQNPSTATSAPVGVALAVSSPAAQSAGLTASYYGWVQTMGVGMVLIDGATTVGLSMVASASVAGAAAPQVAGASSLAASVIGTAFQTGTTTDIGAIKLCIG